MATDGLTPPLRPNASVVLLLVPAGALIALNLSQLTVAAGIIAMVLATLVAAFLLRRPGPEFSPYVLIIAELSPISLSARLPTVLAYQALAVLLLTAMLAPFPSFAKLSIYAKPALITIIIVATSLAPGLVLAHAKALTPLQSASFSGAILLVVTSVILLVRRDAPPFQVLGS
jgi:hypothetical protein